MTLSDFTLILAPAPDAGEANALRLAMDRGLDFRGSVTTGALASVPYPFSRSGGVCHSCRVTEQGILVFVDRHRLRPGHLYADITARVPDPDFADGFRDVTAAIDTGRTLTADTDSVTAFVGKGDFLSKGEAQALIAEADGKLMAQVMGEIASLREQPSDNLRFKTFSLTVEDGLLRARGFRELADKGYVPYLFRNTRKRSAYSLRLREEYGTDRKYCPMRKGWNVWGGRGCVAIRDGIVHFTSHWHDNLTSSFTPKWTTEPTAILSQYSWRGNDCVTWGRSRIVLNDRKVYKRPRMVRLRCALAFGPECRGCHTRITPDMMATPLVEFSLIYDPSHKTWFFGR